MNSTKPESVTASAILEFVWQCPRCGLRNNTRTEYRDVYIDTRCGHCHQGCVLDYHQTTDRPALNTACPTTNLLASVSTMKASRRNAKQSAHRR